ncbi:MAG: tetratricopeptide repeat protein [Bacteroidia bacterium]|nr:tetratricopeptide repeat protein [Bacteroidia bacterium]
MMMLGLLMALPLHVQSQTAYERLIEKGMVHASAGEYPDAIPIFKEAIRLNPDGVEGHYGLGYCYSLRCYEENQDCEAAMQEFTIAIHIDPSFRHSYFNRAVARTYLDDWEGALSDLNRQIHADDRKAMYFSRRAEVLYHLNRYEEACADIQVVRQLGGAYAHDWFDTLCPER